MLLFGNKGASYSPERVQLALSEATSLIAKLVRISLAVAMLSLGTALVAQVQNGGFETGDFTGWTLSGDTSFIGVCSTPTCPGNFAPYDGTYAAYFGPVGDTATISQEIPTTPGAMYTLDFYLANPGGGTPNYFQAALGTANFTITNFGAAFGWTEFSLTDQATTSQTELSFTFRNDPGYWFLDDVSVSSSAQGTTPEPSSFILLGTGLVGAVGFARRRFNR